MNRLLVTGATGFIGTPCVLRAAAEFEVHAVARNRGPFAPRVVPHACDLFDREAVTRLLAEVRPTHLLHLAWIATPGVYWTSPENHRWVEASKHLLTAFAECGGQRAVAAGTCAEYDWTGDGVCRERETPTRLATLYGQCKNELREWCERVFGNPTPQPPPPAGEGEPEIAPLPTLACSRGCDRRRGAAREANREGRRAKGAGWGEYQQPVRPLTIAWARLFFLCGPREHPARLVPSVARALLAGEVAECSAGTQRRDFLHVDDVADALVALLQSDATGPVNIGSGEAVTVRDVIDLVARACGRPDLVRLGARPTPANEPPLLVPDVARLRDEVGWRPRISLEDGIADAVLYWRARRAA